MPMFDDKHIKINGCTVVWDGITRPDTDPNGNIKYSLKLVIDPNNPDLALFNQLAQNTLQQSKFQGVLPAGGLMPCGVAGPQEFGGMFNGFAVIAAKSQFVPDVYDEAGALMEAMQYGPLLYGGQKVDVLVHCYAYDKAGNRGVSTGLDAFSIIASAQAPRQEFGGGGIATAGAFGQAPAQAYPQPPVQPAAPLPPGTFPPPAPALQGGQQAQPPGPQAIQYQAPAAQAQPGQAPAQAYMPPVQQ